MTTIAIQTTASDVQKANAAAEAARQGIIKMAEAHALELAHALRAYDAAVLRAEQLRREFEASGEVMVHVGD